jgi:hypothetical protein
MGLTFVGMYSLRLWANYALRGAVKNLRNAQQVYEYSYRRFLEEQQICIDGCNALAENRQATLDGRWTQLHTFLVSSGVNGGLFTPPRGVFRDRPEEDVRSALLSSQLLRAGNNGSALTAVPLRNSATILIQGLRWSDSLGVVHVNILHERLHDVVISLSPELGDELVKAMGSLGDMEVGDVLGGALHALSLARAGLIFASVSEYGAKASRLRLEAERLDKKRAILEAANQRIPILLLELEVASYQLFRWTVISQEVARFQRAAYGRKRNVSDLPRWVLNGVLRYATELWSTFDDPVFC